MIVRTGNAPHQRLDFGPWIDTLNGTGAPASAPIARRATPEELARLDAPDVMPRIIDAIGLIPRPIRGRYTDAERIARTLRSSAVRGAESTARRHPRPKAQRHPDDVVLAAVLEHRGNRSAAGRALGVSEQSLHRRIAFLRASGRLPDEVAAVLAGRKGGMR